MATDTDIREIKTAIEANTKAIEAIAKGTEANTKAIADLTASVTGLREEMRVGFANVDTKFAKLEGKIDTAEAKLEGKIDKIDERTKLGFWGFILRGTVLALILIVIKYLLRSIEPIQIWTSPLLMSTSYFNGGIGAAIPL